METKIYTVEELKDFVIQMMVNKSDGKVTKIADNSVFNGIAFGIAKIEQKAMKDSALIESELFPEYAYGQYLDIVAKRSGVTERQQNQGSSVYVRLAAVPTSLYQATECEFISTSGYSFVLEEDFIIGEHGYGYAKLKSVDIGSNTNVPANSITKVINGPSGHKYCINEYPAFGGVSVESDISLKNRILQNFNNFAFDTIAKLTATFQMLNPLILDVKKTGVDSTGKTILSLTTINGTSLNEQDLDYLLSKAKYYLSLMDIPSVNGLDNSPNIVLQNTEFVFVDLDFRVDLYNNINPDTFRQNVQLQLSEYLDFRKWGTKTKVEWEDLYYFVRNQEGVKTIPEQYFYPHEDIDVPLAKYPRLRGFVMRNLDGEVLQDLQGNVLPIYYPVDIATNIFTQINVNYGF